MKAVSLEEARRLLKQHILRKETEQVSVLDCADRILAEDIFTQIDQPPFRRSERDGYAVRSIDTRGASLNNPIQMKVIDCVYAGTNEEKELIPGSAVRIMTGGMLPKAADCVVMQEDTDYGEQVVSIYREMSCGEYYSPIGSDFLQGIKIANAGIKIDANVIATTVAAGLMKLPVRQRVKAAVITTGDELCVLGEERKLGQIYPSNLAYLCTRLKQLGCEVMQVCQPGDHLDTIADAIYTAIEKADVVITTGGVSVGEKDYLERAVKKIGAKVLFHGLAVNPGRPTMVSLYEHKPILSLTGSPCSAGIVFELLIHSVLAVMLDTEQMEMQSVSAIAQEDFSTSQKRSRQFVKGCFSDGKVYRVDKHRRVQNFSGVGCNCLIDIMEEKDEIYSGEQVHVYLL